MRAFYGQSFVIPKNTQKATKMLYVLAATVGVITSSLFSAQMAKLITAPPKEPLSNSFESLFKRNITVLVAEVFRDSLRQYTKPEFYDTYSKTGFTWVQTIEEFTQKRLAWDPHYAYTVSAETWSILDQQQHYFATRLFRLSDNLTFNGFVLSSIPLPENSYFKEPLNEFVLKSTQFGLFQYWYSMAFYDMMQLKRIQLMDFSKPSVFEISNIWDFQYIFVLNTTFYVCCIIIFVGEILWFKRKLNQRKRRIET